MTKISFGILVFALVLTEVVSWTIDLPEARKFLFEKNDHLEKKVGEHHNKLEISKQVFYSNREHSNSKHHEHHADQDHDPYAREYGYQAYMEKKVRHIVYDGSEYLEGLQHSIEEFSQLLANCSRNHTMSGYSNSNTTSNSSSTQEPWRPSNERAPTNRTEEDSERCRRASRSSEHVRRLADLATKTTKELQDIAYSRKYLKNDPHELSKEENELILKLAWFLDQLAHYTGYHPHAETHPRGDWSHYSSSTTPAPTAVTLVPAPEPVKQQMMNCLHQKSSVPADERCRYPLPIPSLPSFNTSNSSSMPASSNINEKVLPLTAGSGSKDQELLIAMDYRPTYLAYPYLRRTVRSVRNVRKRSTPETEATNLSEAADPATTFMKYFVKHKIWDGDNPTKLKSNLFEKFEVNNHLRQIRKRAASDHKLRIQEDPFQDLSKYVKHKKGVHHVKDEILAQKINNYISKILNPKALPKELSRKLSKLLRAKRSYRFETNVDKPRDPEDLFKDISYYVKNKKGTTFRNDLVQAAQLRAGLEQIFLNPNIETVRRYGANFNPLVPDPLMFGIIRSGADNV